MEGSNCNSVSLCVNIALIGLRAANDVIVLE